MFHAPNQHTLGHDINVDINWTWTEKMGHGHIGNRQGTPIWDKDMETQHAHAHWTWTWNTNIIHGLSASQYVS
jgi:hypothetical protein